ncbi:MAG: hypothetical protein U5R31_16880 [Acidimicrobiia bacterium]|nr:hypothetical protein [Acidimicrobiia bacterium]
MTDEDLADARVPFTEGPLTSPRGRVYFVDPANPGRVLWLPASNLALVITAEGSDQAVEVLDGLECEAPSPRCVAGDEVIDSDQCAEGEVVLIEGPDTTDTASVVPD